MSQKSAMKKNWLNNGNTTTYINMLEVRIF